jgi:hypothetical protein
MNGVFLFKMIPLEELPLPPEESSDSEIRKWMRSRSNAEIYEAINFSHEMGKNVDVIKNRIEFLLPHLVRRSDLRITRGDIQKLGIPKFDANKIFYHLFDLVTDNPHLNDSDTLIKMAKAISTSRSKI